MDDFPCYPDYYFKEDRTTLDMLHADDAHIREQETKFEFVDSILQRFDDEMDLRFTCNLSSMCNDYFIDAAYDEHSVLEGTSDNGLKGSYSEFKTESITRDNTTSGMSNISNTALPLAECTSDQGASFLDNMSVQELQDTFRSTFGRDTGVKDKQWLKRRILFGLQNLGEVYDAPRGEDNDILIPGSNMFERVYTLLTDVNDRRTMIVGRGFEGDEHLGMRSKMAIHEVTRDGHFPSSLTVAETALLSNKRMRKPTRRYIEEMSEIESNCHNGRLNTSIKSSTEKLMHGRTKRHLSKGDSPVTSILHPESESLDDIADDCATENKKSGIRKYHRQWTLTEVVKLVDGVSQYGVGRWSEIKRQVFPTSPYRTSVDLKDKWRNLLKASALQLSNKNKDNACKSPIPKSELQRVRELSANYLYPRERKSKLPSPASSRHQWY